jgi:hypothetical protein
MVAEEETFAELVRSKRAHRYQLPGAHHEDRWLGDLDAHTAEWGLTPMVFDFLLGN